MLEYTPTPIENDRLTGIPYVPSKHVGGEITPSVIVVHDTAGPLDTGSSVAWLRSNPKQVSAHVVVERDGSVTQLVPFNRRANHAGRSHYHGRNWVNGFGIGIEIVNPGRMTLGIERGASVARAWWGASYDLDSYEIQEMTTREHGQGWWMPCTPEQISAVVKLGIRIADAYPIIDLVPHWYVSPGRKIDTNPLFPLDEVRTVVLGRDGAAEGMADEASSEAPSGRFVKVRVPGGDTLNMRRWPSFNPNVVAAIPSGVEVPALREGVFGGRPWVKVVYGGQEGWIVSRYTEEA